MLTQNVATVHVTDEELALILARRNGNAVAEVESPTMPLSMGLNSRVLYTSQGGRTKEYVVRWIGPDNKRPGVTRVGLPCGGKRGKLFFVDADKCRLI